MDDERSRSREYGVQTLKSPKLIKELSMKMTINKMGLGISIAMLSRHSN